MTTKKEILEYLSHRSWGNIIDVFPANPATPARCHFCDKADAELVAVLSLKLSNVRRPVCSDFTACEVRVKKNREDEQLAYQKTQEYLGTLELPPKES